jgi:hypothetical protein
MMGGTRSARRRINMQLTPQTSGRSQPRSVAGNVIRGSRGNLIEWYDWYAARGDAVERNIGRKRVYTSPGRSDLRVLADGLAPATSDSRLVPRFHTKLRGGT